jgi:uncharacterized protein (TIGR02231 family)
MGVTDILTEIKRVTIFQEGAQVTREGTTSLEPGVNTVRFPGLPRDLDRESFRVTGSGPAKILNMVIKPFYTEKELPEDAKALVDRIESMQRELTQLDDKLGLKRTTVEQLKASLVGATKKFARYSALGKAEYTSFADLGDTTAGRIVAVIAEISDLTIERDELARKIDAARSDAEKIRARAGAVEYTDVFLDIEVDGSDELAFSLNYIFKGRQASWQPIYEIYLGEESTGVSLRMNATVANNSGEDWAQALLTLSTANIRPVDITEPSPYMIRAHKPVPRPVPTAAPMAKKRFAASGLRAVSGATAGAPRNAIREEMDFGGEAEVVVMEPEEAEPEPVEMEISSTSENEASGFQTYTISDPVDILKGKEAGPFFLKEISLITALEIFWSPAQDAAIARNVVTNTNQLLLPGKTRTYIDNEFAGESPMPLTRPFEEFTTAVRECKVLKIKRKIVDRGGKKAGAIIKDKVSKHYSYEIEIERVQTVDAKLVVMDAVPVSDSTKIMVQDMKIYPDPDKNVNGVVTWNFATKDLEEKTAIDYEFSIVYDRNVVFETPLP